VKFITKAARRKRTPDRRTAAGCRESAVEDWLKRRIEREDRRSVVEGQRQTAKRDERRQSGDERRYAPIGGDQADQQAEADPRNEDQWNASSSGMPMNLSIWAKIMVSNATIEPELRSIPAAKITIVDPMAIKRNDADLQ
jgi:hypothetical protein